MANQNITGLNAQSTFVNGGGGVRRLIQIFSTDNQATVEAPGYLTKNDVGPRINDGDILEIHGNGFVQRYSVTTNATTGVLTLTQNGGIGMGAVGASTFAGLTDTPASWPVNLPGVMRNDGLGGLSWDSTPSYGTPQFNLDFSAKVTDALPEGVFNLYWTSARFNTAFGAKRVGELLDVADVMGTPGQTLVVNAAGTALEYATAAGAAGGTFVALTDTPAALGGPAQYLRMNALGTGMEWGNVVVAETFSAANFNAAGQIPFGTGFNTFSMLNVGAPGQVLTVNGTGNGLVWTSAVGVTTFLGLTDTASAFGPVGSVVKVNSTGTGLDFEPKYAEFNATGDILYATGNDIGTRLPIGTLGQVLAVGPGNVPIWTAPAATIETLAATIIDNPGDMVVGTANDTPVRLGIGTAAQVLTVNAAGNFPEWQTLALTTTFAALTDTPAGYVGQAGRYPRVNTGETAIELVQPTLLELGDTPAVYGAVGHVLRVNALGTAVEFGELFTIMDAVGDLIVGTGPDTAARLAIGTAGQTLRVNATANALEWGNTFEVVDAVGDIIYGSAPDAVAKLPIGLPGQVLKVNAGATAPEWGAAPSSVTPVDNIGALPAPGTLLGGALYAVCNDPGNDGIYKVDGVIGAAGVGYTKL